MADAGYHSKENVERCVEQDIEPYIAGSRERHNQALEDRLNAVPECPADADAVTAMKYRLQTAEGKAIYSKRKAGGNGVRGDQGGAGIPALSSARVTRRRGRMESGVHGVESEAAVCPGGYRMIGIRGSRFRRNRSAAGEGVGDSLGNIFQSYEHGGSVSTGGGPRQTLTSPRGPRYTSRVVGPTGDKCLSDAVRWRVGDYLHVTRQFGK